MAPVLRAFLAFALLLCGVPLNRVLQQVRSVRESRYGILRGFFHGASDAQEDLTERNHLRLHSVPLAAGRGQVDIKLGEGSRVGPFTAVFTPGHAADHYSLVGEGACFTGDAVLGTGSVFISPYPGAMAGYLLALTRLRLREDFNVLCPGHGPPVWDAHSRLERYAAHRIDRENHLIMALGEGKRTVDELLDAVRVRTAAELDARLRTGEAPRDAGASPTRPS